MNITEYRNELLETKTNKEKEIKEWNESFIVKNGTIIGLFSLVLLVVGIIFLVSSVVFLYDSFPTFTNSQTINNGVFAFVMSIPLMLGFGLGALYSLAVANNSDFQETKLKELDTEIEVLNKVIRGEEVDADVAISVFEKNGTPRSKQVIDMANLLVEDVYNKCSGVKFKDGVLKKT